MNINSTERAFQGIWIPAEIWLCNDLNVMEKLFLVEITSLDNKNGCYASNAHFSEFFGVGKARCTQIIKSLEAKELITITLHKKGKLVQKRVLKRIENCSKKTCEKELKNDGKSEEKASDEVLNKLNHPIKYIKPPIKYIKSGYLENDQGINTKINNTNNKILLSETVNFPESSVEISQQKTRTKKPSFIRDIFNLYPAHRRGGTDQLLWKTWKQEKLTEHDALNILDWLNRAAQSDPQWGTNANGQFVNGIVKFIRERKWLTPIPVVQHSSSQSLDMDDMTWAEDLNEGLL